jgi:hypothetical protein
MIKKGGVSKDKIYLKTTDFTDFSDLSLTDSVTYIIRSIRVQRKGTSFVGMCLRTRQDVPSLG